MTAYGGRTPLLLGVSWMEMAITTVIIAVRAYTKFKLVPRKGGWALTWAVLGWGTACFNAASLSIAAHHGMGNHIKFLAPEDIADSVLWVWIANATTLISISFGKIAVVAFLMDIQGETYRTKRIVLYFICASTVLLNLATVLIIFNQCSPPRRLWQANLPGDCRVKSVNSIAGTVCGAYGAFIDLVLAAYPISLVYRLQINTRLKLGIVTLMALGVFSSACGIVKTVKIATAVESEDPTYDVTSLALWGATEMWVVIICCSIPPCWPLAAHLFCKNKIRSRNGKHKKASQRSDFPLPNIQGTHQAYTCQRSHSSTGPTHGSNQDIDESMPEYGILIRTDVSVFVL